MSKDPYGFIAKRYDAIFESMNAGLFNLGVKLSQATEGMSVLDVGCGTGMQLARYQKEGCQIWGIDMSPAMMDVARQKLGDTAELHLGDATNMPFDDDSFDLITSTLVIHEMDPPIRDGVLQEMKRVMKENGRILLIDFHPGQLRLPKGLFTKLFITLSEFLAGRQHFRNYRHFMAHKGLPQLVSQHNLSIKQQKIVSGGNMAIFLLSQENNTASSTQN